MKSYKRVHQIGFIVEDLEKAMKEYSEIYHIKSWFRAVNDPPGKIFYKGKEIEDKGFDAIIGYCGKTEIELITSTAEENIYTTFLREQGPGIHHICFFVKNIDKSISEYEKKGFEVLQYGEMVGKSMISRYVYLVKPGEKFSRIVELGESKLYGKLSITRRKPLLWLGTLTGDTQKL